MEGKLLCRLFQGFGVKVMLEKGRLLQVGQSF
jgi:hypothetical protein